MFWAIVFFGLTTAVFASATMDVLGNAAASFSATIQRQLDEVTRPTLPVHYGVRDLLRPPTILR
jgi:hypothetical protein